MKKYIVLIFLAFLIVLSACQKEPVEHVIYISKYYESTSLLNSSIEIYNPSDEDINLDNYAIDIYPNGSTVKEYSIKLSGNIGKQGYFLITSNQPTHALLIEKSDLKTDQLLFNGNDAIVLSYKEEIVDTIGTIGQAIDFAKDVTLIRKDHANVPNPTYVPYDFMMYLPNVFEYIKNRDYPVTNNQQALDGPRLTDEYRQMPFVDPNNQSLGGGGTIRVNLVSVADGDTATFATLDGTVTYRVRFFFIDTREVQGTGSPNGQPWGYPASAYTKDILNRAKEQNSVIELQSIKGNSLTDGYDRFLGLVRVDSELVNYMVVRAGLSDVNDAGISQNIISMAYQNIPYFSYLRNAWERAQMNGWGIFSNDPQWNYDTGRPILPITELPDPRFYDSDIDE
jgi:endonuclease YncB( thermonuclease family)